MLRKYHKGEKINVRQVGAPYSQYRGGERCKVICSRKTCSLGETWDGKAWVIG